jgi:hypothetical protein
MCIIGPSSHKAGKAGRFRGKTGKDIKEMSRNNTSISKKKPGCNCLIMPYFALLAQ